MVSSTLGLPCLLIARTALSLQHSVCDHRGPAAPASATASVLPSCCWPLSNALAFQGMGLTLAILLLRPMMGQVIAKAHCFVTSSMAATPVCTLAA